MGTGVDNGAPPPYSPPPGRPWNPPAPQPPAPQWPQWPAQQTAPPPHPPAHDAHPHDPGAPSGHPWGQGTGDARTVFDPARTTAPAGPCTAAPPHDVPGARPAGHTAAHGAHGSRAAGRRSPKIPPAAAACLALGALLLCGAGAAALFGGGTPAGAAGDFTAGRDLWHDRGVDTIFPRTVHGPRSGPGDSDRTWTRIGVAPDSTCAGAFDPPLAKALATAGCVRLLRATYTDSTSTDVTTVGILVTRTTPAGQAALRAAMNSRTAADPSALPLPVAFPGTAAARFGPEQRGSWSIQVPTSLPVVVYAVSGLADGRALTPQPATAAEKSGATTVPAQAGLGFEANGLATAVSRALTGTAGGSHPEHTR